MTAGARIAARIERGLARVGRRTGAGPLTATITRPSAETDEPTHPWDPPASPANAPTTYSVTVVDDGLRDFHAPGGLVTRTARVLTIAATGVVPQKADTITLRGLDHVIDEVRATAPGGVDLLYEVALQG